MANKASLKKTTLLHRAMWLVWTTRGVPGLRIGASFYYCADAGSNSDKADTYSSTGKIPVRIYTADAQYLSLIHI